MLSLRRSTEMDEYRLGVFLYKKMELRYWLVHGNVKNNRINRLNEKCSLTPKGSWLRVPIWKENFCSKALRLFLLPQCTRGRSQVWDLLLRIIGEIKVSRDRFTCVFVASLYVTEVTSKSVVQWSSWWVEMISDLDGSYRSRYFRSVANEKNMLVVWIALLT